jgi:hypothetical protein
MKFDNAKRAGIIKLIYMLVPLLVVFAAAITYMYFDAKDLRYMVFAFVGLLIFFFIMSIIKYSYIIFYAGPDKITIRYKTLSPFNTPSNSVKIKVEEFKNYEIKTSIMGIKKTLILYQQTPSGLAKYPPIGFSALKSDEIDKITKAFKLILAMNKK